MELNFENFGNISNIEEHCLACLGKNELTKNITENREILATFKTTFNLKIKVEDGSPKYLCDVCDNKLYYAARFLEQVQNSLQYFKEYKSSQNNSQEIKQEEKNELYFKVEEFENDDNNYDHIGNNSGSESDNEPLIKLVIKKASKKVPFNAKLKKVPLKHVEQAMKEYQSKCRENSSCILCDFKGLSIRNLSCHMIFKHKEEKDNWCSRCNMLITDDLENHKKTHTNKMWCRFCSKNVSRCHYLEHLKFHAGLIYPCEHCPKKFISLLTLDEHRAQHQQNTPFQCNVCQKFFKIRKSLEDHISLHGRYRCTECEKNFEIPELLGSHLCIGKPLKKDNVILEDVKISSEELDQEIVESLESRLLEKCENIEENNIKENENFKSKIEIKEVESLTCHFCQRNYKTAYKLQKHIEGHMGIFLAKCRYCDKGFSSNSDLTNHERVHTKEKPFICSVCGKGFVSSATLRVHMTQHTGKPEVCDLCNKRFCRKSELRLHLQKHRGERPFLCTDCGKSFAQKSHLTCHLTMHSEERPYSCKICEKAFKKKELLKHHMKLHGGEKKFKCTVCFYECHKNYRLQQHMKMHEGKSDLKVNLCQLCGKGFSSVGLLNSHMSNVHNVIV